MANTEETLKKLFDELGKNAYNPTYHNYYFKEANQTIRKFFESINLALGKPEPLAKNKQTDESCPNTSCPIIRYDNGEAYCTKCDWTD